MQSCVVWTASGLPEQGHGQVADVLQFSCVTSLQSRPLAAGFQDQAGPNVKASSDAAQPPATELASAIRQKAAAAAATAGLSSAAPQNPRPAAATLSTAPGGAPKDDAIWQDNHASRPVKNPANTSTPCMALRSAWPLRAAAVKTQPADGPPENFRPMSTAASTSPALQRSPSARSHFTPMRNHDYVRYPMNPRRASTSAACDSLPCFQALSAWGAVVWSLAWRHISRPETPLLSSMQECTQTQHGWFQPHCLQAVVGPPLAAGLGGVHRCRLPATACVHSHVCQLCTAAAAAALGALEDPSAAAGSQTRYDLLDRGQCYPRVCMQSTKALNCAWLGWDCDADLPVL